MELEHRGFRLVLIDEPEHSHITAWEMAARALRNEDAKPVLNKIMTELRRVDITQSDPGALLAVLSLVSQGIDTAVRIINDNESLTLSANDAVMVKAAIKAGWITEPELTEADIDHMKPAWRVRWIAEQVASVYMKATTVPKN